MAYPPNDSIPPPRESSFRQASLLLLQRREPHHLLAMRQALDTSDTAPHGEVAVFLMLLSSFVHGETSSRASAQALIDQLDLDRLFTRQAEDLHSQGGPQPRRRAHGLRIAIAAPQLGRLSNPPTRLAYEHARLLHEMGAEVMVFGAQEIAGSVLADHCGAPIQNPFAPLQKSEWVNAFGPGLRLWTASAAETVPHRWRGLLGKLAAFAPDAVLCVTGHSALPAMVRLAWPALVLSTSGFAPWCKADVWLTSCGHAEDRPYPFRTRIERSAADAPACSRSALGVPERAVLMLTTGIRLEAEIGGDWAAAVKHLLVRHPEVHWLLIGSRMPASLLDMADRITALPFREDLSAVMNTCDLYLNPPRPGGGASVALAMACGLPVVSNADGDGGDKLGPLACTDDNTCFTKLDALLATPEERAMAGKATQQRYWTELDLTLAGPMLLSAVGTARDRFSRRTGLGGSA